MRRTLRLLATATSLALTPFALHAEPAQPTPISDDADFSNYDIRARQLVALLNGDLAADIYFSDYFLKMVPTEQIDALRTQLTNAHGKALNAHVVHRESDHSGAVEIIFADGVASFDLVTDIAEPYRVAGLLYTGFAIPDDSYAAIDAEFAALPGQVGYAVAELGENSTDFIAVRAPETQFAVGSAFKLYVLAELAARVREGDTDWSAVTTLGRPSLPSGIMQDWPQGMPTTQATLATAMIALSDNSATDTLIATLGRDEVAERLAKIGNGAPDRTLPFLTTLEAFALKMSANDKARAAYLALPESKQAAWLDTFSAGLDRRAISDAELVSGPRYIDSIEWFASPTDMVALLAYLERLDDPFVRQILSINPGVGKSDAARWAYLGYKGGSEPGVINMSFLGQRPDGQWVVVTGSWNDTSAPIDDAAFAVLMTRLLNVAVGE